MTIDLITIWPRNCDYPLWRQFVRDNRYRFGKVIIPFMETNQGFNYRELVKWTMENDRVIFFDAPIPIADQDWRNLATNAALDLSDADWVWFTEQDFYPHPGFWDQVELLTKSNDVVAVYQGTRLHPCCIFAKRSIINKTKRNFGIVPNKHDHFYLIQKDLEKMGAKIGTIDEKLYFHYNGLSHNWNLASNGQEPVYHLSEFVDWLKKCLAVSVARDNHFIEIAHAVIGKYDRPETPPTTPPDHSPTVKTPDFVRERGDTP